MFYKKTETRLKHDKVRSKHIEEINELENEYFQKPSKELGEKITRYYKQLEIYDEIFYKIGG